MARPSLHLDEGFDLYAMPNDTLRRVLEDKKILRAAVFRPSSRTRIDALRQSLPPTEQSLALDLARGTRTADDPALKSLPPEARARVIELAQDYLEDHSTAGTGRATSWPRGPWPSSRPAAASRTWADHPTRRHRRYAPIRATCPAAPCRASA